MGVSSRRLSSPEFVPLLPGLLTPRAEPATLEDMARALQTQVVPGAVLSHTTAAVFHGVPVPWSADGGIGLLTHRPDPLSGTKRLSLFIPAPAGGAASSPGSGGKTPRSPILRVPHLHIRIQGPRLSAGQNVTIHRMVPGATVAWHGLVLSSLWEVLLELALTLDHDEVVIAIDHLVGPAGGRPGVDLARVRKEVAEFAGRRGHRALLAAVDDAREGVESPGETRTRLLLIRAGFPEPTCNLPVRDPDSGQLRRIDAAYDRWRIGIEYDGDVHRGRGEWRNEHARRDSLESIGWTLRRLTADDIRAPARFLTALRRTFLAAGASAPAQSTWDGAAAQALGRPQKRPGSGSGSGSGRQV